MSEASAVYRNFRYFRPVPACHCLYTGTLRYASSIYLPRVYHARARIKFPVAAAVLVSYINAGVAVANESRRRFDEGRDCQGKVISLPAEPWNQTSRTVRANSLVPARITHSEPSIRVARVAGRGYRAAVNSELEQHRRTTTKRNGEGEGGGGPRKSHGRSPVAWHRGAIVCAAKIGRVPAVAIATSRNRNIRYDRFIGIDVCRSFLPVYREQVTDRHSASPNKIRGLR